MSSDVETGRLTTDTGLDLTSSDTGVADALFTRYPRRTILCFSLFGGQALLNHALFFAHGDSLTTVFDVTRTGWYLAMSRVSNVIHALVLSPLFDTVGRVKMISGTYIVSAVLLGIAGMVLGDLNATTLTMFGCITFFFASAGPSARLPDRERGRPARDEGAVHRALPRDQYGGRRHRRPMAVGAADRRRLGEQRRHRPGDRLLHRLTLMVIGGVVEACLGVEAEGQSLQGIAQAAHRRGREGRRIGRQQRDRGSDAAEEPQFTRRRLSSVSSSSVAS